MTATNGAVEQPVQRVGEVQAKLRRVVFAPAARFEIDFIGVHGFGETDRLLAIAFSSACQVLGALQRLPVAHNAFAVSVLVIVGKCKTFEPAVALHRPCTRASVTTIQLVRVNVVITVT